MTKTFCDSCSKELEHKVRSYFLVMPPDSSNSRISIEIVNLDLCGQCLVRKISERVLSFS